MKLQFIGHSAFYLETTQMKALIDPFITGNPQATCHVDDFKDISHIFVTHGHGDHLGDTLYLAKKHDALVITNFEIANFLANQGVRVHPMHIGGRKTFDFATIKMTHALHGSSISSENGTIDGGHSGGFLITADNKVVYHAGDTGLSLDMKLLAEERVDVALLPIGGNFTMDTYDALRAVSFIQPKVTIPMHYNTFDVIQADPTAFADQCHDSVVKILKPSESYTI